MKWNLANLLISVFGAALQFALLAQSRMPAQLLYGALGVLLTLRAVKYYNKLGERDS